MLCALNNNSLNSDRSKIANEKYDIMMKDIALSARKKYKLMIDIDG